MGPVCHAPIASQTSYDYLCTRLNEISARLISIDARFPANAGDNLSQEFKEIEMSALVSSNNCINEAMKHHSSEIVKLRQENKSLQDLVTSLSNQVSMMCSKLEQTPVIDSCDIVNGLAESVNHDTNYDMNPSAPTFEIDTEQQPGQTHINFMHQENQFNPQPVHPPENYATAPIKTLIIGGSTLKHFSSGRLSTPHCFTKVQTNSGAKVADVTRKLSNFPGVQDSDHVVLHAGTNNIGRQSDQQILDEYREFIHQTRQIVPNCNISISSILPRPHDPKSNAQIFNVNSALYNLCTNNNVQFIDNSPAFFKNVTNSPNSELFEDNIHIGFNRTKVLARTICNAVGITQFIDPLTFRLRPGHDQRSYFPQRRFPGGNPRYTTQQPQPLFRPMQFSRPGPSEYHQEPAPTFNPYPRRFQQQLPTPSFQAEWY